MTLRLASGINRRNKNLTAADVMKSNPKSIGHKATACNAAKFFCD